MKRTLRLSRDHHYFKTNTWSSFCSKDYPRSGISDLEFVKIILKQAKKTYLRYVRFYYSIDVYDKERSSKQLIIAERNLSKLFNILHEVKNKFNVQIKKWHLEKRFNKFLNDIEIFALGVLDDWIVISNLILIKKLEQSLAA